MGRECLFCAGLPAGEESWGKLRQASVTKGFSQGGDGSGKGTEEMRAHDGHQRRRGHVTSSAWVTMELRTAPGR